MSRHSNRQRPMPSSLLHIFYLLSIPRLHSYQSFLFSRTLTCHTPHVGRPMNWWLQNTSKWHNHDCIDTMLRLQLLMEGLAIKHVMYAAVDIAPRTIAKIFNCEQQYRHQAEGFLCSIDFRNIVLNRSPSKSLAFSILCPHDGAFRSPLWMCDDRSKKKVLHDRELSQDFTLVHA